MKIPEIKLNNEKHDKYYNIKYLIRFACNYAKISS